MQKELQRQNLLESTDGTITLRCTIHRERLWGLGGELAEVRAQCKALVLVVLNILVLLGAL